MNDKQLLLAEMLQTLAQQRSVASGFAQRCGIRDPEFVDMAIQEASMRLLSDGVRTFDPNRGKVKPFVAGLLYHSCVWVLRTFYRTYPIPEGYEQGISEFNPLDVAIRREEISQASEAIDRLPAHLRTAARRSPERRRKSRPGTLKVVRTSTGNVHYFRAKDRFLSKLVAIRREERTRQRRSRK